MQYQGSKFDLEKREDERRMLQDLVGKNLTFLSQLDGLDFNLYSSIVLKRVTPHLQERPVQILQGAGCKRKDLRA